MKGTTIYRFDRNGRAKAERSPSRSAERVRWTEADLQHVLTLNSELIGVTAERPIIVQPGKNVVSPDQLYVGEAGRLTIVEIKRVEASVADLVQLLGYGEHLRSLPPDIGHFLTLTHAGRHAGKGWTLEDHMALARRNLLALGDGRTRERVEVCRPPLRGEARSPRRDASSSGASQRGTSAPAH